MNGLLAAIGGTPSMSVRNVAELKPEERTELEGTIVLPDEAQLSLFDKLAIRTFFRQADRIVALPPLVPTYASSLPAASASSPAPASTASANPGIRCALILNQVDDRIAQPLGNDEHLRYLERYSLTFGDGLEPPPEQEPAHRALFRASPPKRGCALGEILDFFVQRFFALVLRVVAP